MLDQISETTYLDNKSMARSKKNLIFKSASDEYVALEVRGEGGAGKVYRAKASGGNEVAVKLLNPSNVTSERRKRFRNETVFCMKNSHKNILTVFDYGISLINGQDCPFYVMPFYGETLRTLMKQGIEQNSVLTYFSQIVDGVEAAHLQNVWHRDLKPENVLFARDTNTLIVADFGIARFVKEDLLTAVETKPGSRLANFQYAAPEQRMRSGIVDYRADIFALGLILNEMFTGEVIFGTSYRTIESTAAGHAYLDGLVESMIRQSPNDRAPSLDVIKQSLIARRNEFVSQQRLNLLKHGVVPTSEVDDPLVIDPVRIVGVDFRGGELIIELNHQLTQVWIQIFRRIVGVTFQMGSDPRKIPFAGKTAHIKLHSDREAQSFVERFKTYLDTANRDYAAWATKKKRDEEGAERLRLQNQAAQEERRLNVLRGITF